MTTSTKEKWNRALTVTLVACALLTTGMVVHREFFTLPTASTQTPTQNPVFVQDWRSYLGQGVRLGSTSAPVQLIEFADFECPYCAIYHKTLKSLRERYPTQISLILMHLPLQGHRFAMPAARVAECAGVQGRFEAMYDRLFDEQESLGLKPWRDYAAEAGVSDLAAFDACTKATQSVPRIEEGKQLAAKLDVKSTPTLIVNGWMLGRPATAEELDTMVNAVLAGKSPVPAGQ